MDRFITLNEEIQHVYPRAAEIISHEDLILLKDIIKFLYLFEAFTKLVSGEENSASIILPFLMSFKANIDNLESQYVNNNSTTNYIKVVLSILKKYSQKYWDNEIVQTAMFLDPHFKHYLIDDKIVFLQKMRNKFDFYNDIFKLDNPIVNSNSSILGNLAILLNQQANIKEIDKYIQEPLLDQNDNIYLFWSKKEKTLPIMGRLAIKYLSTVPTSIDSERMGSSQAILLSKFRTSTKPTKVEQIVICKKYLDKMDLKDII